MSTDAAVGTTTGDRTVAPVLQVSDLRVRFGTKRGIARVLNGISYDLARGETLAIVGESGSGKSIGVLALMGLVPQPPARVTGSVRLEGTELVGADPGTLRSIRGNRIAMIFQDPMTSLNPVHTIGRQVGEALRVHRGLSKRAAFERSAELLALVGISSPRQRLSQHPHELSGGMRQRVMIAMGLSTDPAVLIADEATTALDVTTQAQITELLQRLQDQLGTSILWITHDLGVVAGIADRVMVMYAGRVVETAPVRQLFASPRHPYTRGLLGSLPRPGVDRPERLESIPGQPPDPTALPDGCAFWERCRYRLDPNEEHTVPELREVAPGHLVACAYDLDELDEHAVGVEVT